MNKISEQNIIAISALLVHVARIDENYTDMEKKLILSYIRLHMLDEKKILDILDKSEKLEADSNQLLNFTNVIKQNSLEFKSTIIENLWKIIISDQNIDYYESGIMRKICGLIYFPDKQSGEIKLKILNQIK